MTAIHDQNNRDYFLVEAPMEDHRGDELQAGAVAFISSGEGGYFDREAVVDFITALTDLVEAHDAEEARKAEAAVKEAAKLKRGDRVRLICDHTWLYTVLSDEDADGRVGLVCLERWGRPAGDLLNDPAEGFERVDEFE